MNTDICGNCNFFNEHKKMVNGSYICNYHGLTTNPTNMGCYKIQKTKNGKNIINILTNKTYNNIL